MAKKNNRIARLLPNGAPRYIRVYDNGGETIDRYTVVFTGRYRHKTGGSHWVLGMNDAPFHPQGFGQHSEYERQVDVNKGGWPPAVGKANHLGKRINFSDLPPDCQTLTMQDYCYLWDISEAVIDETGAR